VVTILGTLISYITSSNDECSVSAPFISNKSKISITLFKLCEFTGLYWLLTCDHHEYLHLSKSYSQVGNDFKFECVMPHDSIRNGDNEKIETCELLTI